MLHSIMAARKDKEHRTLADYTWIEWIFYTVLVFTIIALLVLLASCGNLGTKNTNSELDAEVQALYCLGLCAHTNMESESIVEMRQEVKALRKQVKKDKQDIQAVDARVDKRKEEVEQVDKRVDKRKKETQDLEEKTK